MSSNVTLQEPQKPTLTFTVFLGIFFCYLFRITIGDISQFSNWIIPEILQSESATLNTIYYIDYFLWIVLGFWSIILALKGTKNAITCLKLCLLFHFFSFLLSIIPKLTGITILSLIILLFPLVFFLYLCFSKEIKDNYPKEERKLGFLGYIGIGLYLILALLFIQGIVAIVIKNQNNKRIEPGEIELSDSELTDGRVIFNPLSQWSLDSVCELNPVQYVFYFHDTTNLSFVDVVCTTEEYEPLRYYYIYSIFENQPMEIRYYKDEIDFKKMETDDYVIFIDQYVYQVDSSYYYWTYASKLGKKVEKGIRLSVLDNDSLKTTIDDAVKFLENSTFDLRGRTIQRKSNKQQTQLLSSL